MARSFADDLRGRDDAALAALLARRPDLLHPASATITELAARASGAVSVSMAVDRLNAFQRQLLSVLVAMLRAHNAADPASLTGAMGLSPADAARLIPPTIEDLYDRGLLWRQGGDLRVPTAVQEAFGPHPCGLDPIDRTARPWIADYAADPGAVESELANAPAAAREALELLAWGPPVGSVANADRPVSEATATTPVEWLLARDLVVSTGPSTVVIPREVALRLRGGRYVREPALPPPPGHLAGTPGPADPATADPAAADPAAGLAALALIRTTADLLEAIGATPPRILRSGGVAQRDLASLGQRLRREPGDVVRLLEWLHSAGLIGADGSSGHWLPTTAADRWARASEATQWAVITLGWWNSPAQPPGGGESGSALSDSLRPIAAAAVRHVVAAAAAEARSAAAATLTAWASWLRPTLGPAVEERASWIAAEMNMLGLAVGENLSSLGLAVAGLPAVAGTATDADSVAGLEEAARGVLPELVDRLILQSDLTAIAPGPLTKAALDRLRTLADQESEGPGGVFRFSGASLRRAFDAGQTSEDIIDSLAELSMTGVPDVLMQTVRDLGRSHGGLRVSEAATVIRADDEAAIAAVLADRRLVDLHLRRLGQGVLASPQPAERVLDRLRASGHLPIGEGSLDKANRPTPKRAKPAPPVVTRPPEPSWIAAAVRAMRRHELTEAATPGGIDLQKPGPHDLVDALKGAIASGTAVWIDYSDQVGQRRTRLVEPLTVRAGSLAAFDHREQRVRSFSLARIAGIAITETIEG